MAVVALGPGDRVFNFLGVEKKLEMIKQMVSWLWEPMVTLFTTGLRSR